MVNKTVACPTQSNMPAVKRGASKATLRRNKHLAEKKDQEQKEAELKAQRDGPL